MENNSGSRTVEERDHHHRHHHRHTTANRNRSRSRAKRKKHHHHHHHRHHRRSSSPSSSSSSSVDSHSSSSRSTHSKKEKIHHKPHHHHHHHDHRERRSSPTVRPSKVSHDTDKNKSSLVDHQSLSSSSPSTALSSTVLPVTIRPVCDLSTAERVLQQLLQVLPALRTELQLLCFTLDEGKEDIIVKDITNPLVRTGIEAFFMKLGAIEEGGKGTGYRLPVYIRQQVRLLEYFQSILVAPNSEEKVSMREATVLPSLENPVPIADNAQKDEDDNIVGPQFTPTGTVRIVHGPSVSSSTQSVPSVSVSNASSSLSSSASSFINAEGLPVSFPSRSMLQQYQNNAGNGSTTSSGNGREGWMMNSGSTELGSIFHRQGSNRNNNSSILLSSGTKGTIGPSLPSAHSSSSSSVGNVATVPRPKSLVELHREALLLQQLPNPSYGMTTMTNPNSSTIRRPFDREKDLEIRKSVNIDNIIANARSLDDRFTAGTSTTQFM